MRLEHATASDSEAILHTTLDLRQQRRVPTAHLQLLVSLLLRRQLRLAVLLQYHLHRVERGHPAQLLVDHREGSWPTPPSATAPRASCPAHT